MARKYCGWSPAVVLLALICVGQGIVIGYLTNHPVLSVSLIPRSSATAAAAWSTEVVARAAEQQRFASRQPASDDSSQTEHALGAPERQGSANGRKAKAASDGGLECDQSSCAHLSIHRLELIGMESQHRHHIEAQLAYYFDSPAMYRHTTMINTCLAPLVRAFPRSEWLTLGDGTFCFESATIRQLAREALPFIPALQMQNVSANLGRVRATLKTDAGRAEQHAALASAESAARNARGRAPADFLKQFPDWQTRVLVHGSALGNATCGHSLRFGYIDEFSAENAEAISLSAESVDVVFVKEAMHHMRRPFRALDEALRVARLGIAFVEPHDTNDALDATATGWERVLAKSAYADFFEANGYQFRFTTRDLLRTAVALNYSVVAVRGMNDPSDESEEAAYFRKLALLDDLGRQGKRSPNLLCGLILKDDWLLDRALQNDLQQQGFLVYRLPHFVVDMSSQESAAAVLRPVVPFKLQPLGSTAAEHG